MMAGTMMSKWLVYHYDCRWIEQGNHNSIDNLFSFFFYHNTLMRRGNGSVVRSLPPNPKVPGSIPGLVGVKLCVTFCPAFSLKFTQLSLFPSKMSASMHDRSGCQMGLNVLSAHWG